ncbi:hypothetical protein FSP39_017207 [Pinctada imbricata]|uniref:Secernin-2 n=1 Tax=Pinctada imbricata TaxID=66713 RepID=A0AA88YMT8_PINIB|nr:hypothetical protein FSP39_017207 [Pinctada imbricata]
MSDIFVALPPATDGPVVFGKNSDRPCSEVQEVIHVPDADHPPGSKVKVTYIEIPQADHTHAVLLSKSSWTWGAEMGVNEHGVCVGCTSVWTKLCKEGDQNAKLIGADFVRLALERSSTAREAVNVMTSLLEEHGQGGVTCVDPSYSQWTYNNSFLIADRTEAWVLETAGKFWVTKQITNGCYNISSTLTIGADMTSSSSNLPEEAEKLGYWSSDKGPFDFTSAFSSEYSGFSLSNPQMPVARQTSGKTLLENFSKNGNFSVGDMFSILRNDDLCFQGELMTTASHVSVLSPPTSNTPHCHWLTATPNPCLSVFKPVIFCKNLDIGNMTKSPSDTMEEASSHRLFKAHQKGTEKMKSGSNEGVALAAMMRQLESQCVSDLDQFLKSCNEDDLGEVTDLFKDITESEVKLYN